MARPSTLLMSVSIRNRCGRDLGRGGGTALYTDEREGPGLVLAVAGGDSDARAAPQLPVVMYVTAGLADVSEGSGQPFPSPVSAWSRPLLL